MFTYNFKKDLICKYPNIDVIANDLYKKGLIEAGEYTINIDW